MEILISNETNLQITPEHEKLLKDIAYVALTKEKIGENVEISLLLVDNEQMREFNKRYRRLDKPTDVLSFPQFSPDSIKTGIETLILGDIIISIEKAREQAAEYGHSFEREFGFLAAHGMLHLFGYDHMDKESETVMIAKQKELLQSCGLGG